MGLPSILEELVFTSKDRISKVFGGGGGLKAYIAQSSRIAARLAHLEITSAFGAKLKLTGRENRRTRSPMTRSGPPTAANLPNKLNERLQ